MRARDRAVLADAFVTASRALVGIAVRSIQQAPEEVTVVQHRVLVLAAAHDGLPVGAVATALAVNASNATRICDRLERLGLLERRRSKTDRRVVEVTVTGAGRELLDAVARRRLAEVERVVARMDERDVRAAVAVLGAFSATAEELSDGEGSAPSW